MPARKQQAAIRTYLASVRPLLRKYKLPVVGRDLPMQEANALHRKLLRKAHPDRGGSTADAQALLSAMAALREATAQEAEAAEHAGDGQGAPAASSNGFAPDAPRKRPAAATDSPGTAKRFAGARVRSPSPDNGTPHPSHQLVPSTTDVCSFCTETSGGPAREYRIQSNGVLLTYNGSALAETGVWHGFKQWVAEHLHAWDVLYHCETMELCRRRRPHLHVMLQFRKAVDKSSKQFAFLGILPNARPTWVDYCRNGRGKRNPQRSLDRGFFYVYANKIGTCTDAGGALCVHGNYGPCWEAWRFHYEASGDWPETLWRRYQLTHAQARAYIIQCRDRVPSRLRNVDEVMKGEEELLDARELAENRERIHGNPDLHKQFKLFPVAQQWLKTFMHDQHRYALMLVRGASRSGKTELAKSWFRTPCAMTVGDLLSVFPAKMRKYNRRYHDGIVLDDIRDLQFLVNFQHVFQGKPDQEIGFAEDTKGGSCSYSKLLFATPFVGTFNDSTKNIDLLYTDDFLSKNENCVVLHLTEPPFEAQPHEAAAPPGAQAPCPRPLAIDDCENEGRTRQEAMSNWTVAEVADFLQGQDLKSAAQVLKRNDFNGRDLVATTRDQLCVSLGMSSFLSDKVLTARQVYLTGQVL